MQAKQPKTLPELLRIKTNDIPWKLTGLIGIAAVDALNVWIIKTQLNNISGLIVRMQFD